MKSIVVYFSKTGNSKRIASEVAKKMSTQAFEIKDDQNWKGIIGFIRGGYYASKDKSVQISYSEAGKAAIAQADQIIVISPMWAGGPAPAIRTFLKTMKAEKIVLVISSAGPGNESKLRAYESPLGKFKGLFNISSKENEATRIQEIVQKISH